MTNAALIARLEKAEEGSRALSDEVLVALGWTRSSKATVAYTSGGDRRVDGWGDPSGVWYGLSANSRPDPTENLQDTVDLVPDGHPWTLDSIGIVEMGTTTGKPVEGIATTLAVAMCIAILRAMETE